MSEIIHKSHNVTALLYHIVCPTRYRRAAINKDVEETIKGTCEGTEDRFEIKFLGIGTEGDRVHFEIQSVPMHSPMKRVTRIKGNIWEQVFEAHPEVKKQLRGGGFWGDG
jgi:REP element-mobilizing transposase RayT